MNYRKGEGVIQDYETAVKWLKLSAEQGNTIAQKNLGQMYEKGWGVSQNNIYAHMWGNISASEGNWDGIELRDRVAKKMTPADISKAQNLARKCVAKNYKGC